MSAQAERMLVKKLSEFAQIPTRGSQFAAGIKKFPDYFMHYYSNLQFIGFDLSSAYDITVPAKGKALIKTDIAIAIPENTYARIGIKI